MMAIRTLRSPTSYSLLLHAVFFAVMLLSIPNLPLSPVPKKMRWIEIELPQSPSSADQTRTRRMVETQPGTRTETPDPNAFEGARNQTVDRETVSRERKNRTAQSGRSSEREERAQTPGNKAAESPAHKNLSHLGLAMLPPNVATEKPDPNQDLARKETRRTDSPDTTSLTSQAPQEYLRGFAESDQTQLNTKESVFFPYIQRIRERLDIAWERTLQERLQRYFKQGRTLREGQDLATQVLVTLDSAGEVQRVQIIEGSGIRDLDHSAVDAFKIAGPFPNPPKGLLNAQGNVEIRWDLVVVS